MGKRTKKTGVFARLRRRQELKDIATAVFLFILNSFEKDINEPPCQFDLKLKGYDDAP